MLPSVSTLLSDSGPSAIAWDIPYRIVNAIQRAALRALAHVGQEVGKVLPAGADSYAAPAIARVIFRVWIFAPSQHAAPGIVFRCAGVPVSYVSGGKLLAAHAPTTKGATAHKGRALVSSNGATVAPGNPVRRLALGVRKTYDCPATVTIADDAFDAGRDWGRLLFSHCASVLCMVVRTAPGTRDARRCSRFKQYTTACTVRQA